MKADTNLSSLTLLVTWTGMVPLQYIRRRFFSAFSRVTQNHPAGGSRERAVLWTWSADRGRLHGLCHGADSTGSLVSFMPWWIQTGETDVWHFNCFQSWCPIFTLNKCDVVTWSARGKKSQTTAARRDKWEMFLSVDPFSKIDLNYFLSCVGK